MIKRAQGLSISMIVIAAIALIVLVVMVLIFTGNIGNFAGGLKDCYSKGGTCESGGGSAADVCKTKNAAYVRGTNCEDENKYCCVPA